MRLVVGSALAIRAGFTWHVPQPMELRIPVMLWTGAGILLIAGLWTPIIGSVVALTEVWKILTFPADKWVLLMMGTLSAALAMLGPGTWSVDARLYGWKRIEPTRPSCTINS